MLPDGGSKEEILAQMQALVQRPATSFRDAEQAVFGSGSKVIDMVNSDSEDEGPAKEARASDPDPAAPAATPRELLFVSDSDASEEFGEEDDESEEENPIQGILAAVYHSSGYVVIDNVVAEPEDRDWYLDCVQDLVTLDKTNNMVRIVNNGGSGSRKKDDRKRHMLMFSSFKCEEKFRGARPAPPSDPATLDRMNKFFKPMFAKMEAKLRSLHLVQAPRKLGEPKILISKPGCAAQRMHYDFDPYVVNQLRDSNQLIGVPISALCSFTPGGSSLLVSEEGRPVRTVRLHFGSMCVFTGDVVHAGSAYKSTNIRGFYHVVNEDLCLYDPDIIWHQYQKKAPPATPPAATHTAPPAVTHTAPPAATHTAPPIAASKSTSEPTVPHHGKQLGSRRRSGRERNAPNRLIENKNV